MMGLWVLWGHTWRRLLLSISLVGSLAVLGAAAGVASSDAGVVPQTSGFRPAIAARVVSLNLTAALHLVGRPSHVDNATGSVTGTFAGRATARFFTSIGSTGGEATFTLYPSSGGSLVGRATTRGRVVGPTAYFKGTATISGGTGRWKRAHGTGVSFNGTFDRQNYHSILIIRGNISV
jgi:hypothetical protein